MPTHRPTRWPTASSANDRLKSKPLAAPRLPRWKYCATSLANTLVATTIANTAETMVPAATASRPPLLLSCAASPAPSPPPTLSTSAQATPSGYGRSESVTSARRSGIVYITPRIPPVAQMPNVTQNGKPVHQPIITSPGSTKMIADSVPAAEATVCTMLFSCTVEFLNPRSMAIEITAAGIEVAKVRPAFRPKNTLAAVNTSVITMPMIRPRTVSSVRGAALDDGVFKRASPPVECCCGR